MQHHDETRRYLARVSRVGIIAAILYALIYGTARFFSLKVLYGGLTTFRVLLVGDWNLFTEVTVAVVGILTLIACGVLSLVGRGKPALTEIAWILAGKITLLAAPVGYIQSLYGVRWNGSRGYDFGEEFLFSFAVFAVIFVGYAFGTRGISVNQGFLHKPKKAYAIRVLGNTAILFGVMLAADLLLVGRIWKDYGAFFGNMSAATKMTNLVLEPLRWTLPVVLVVVLSYPLLSLVARWNEAPKSRLLGKGSTGFMWVTLTMAGVSAVVSLTYQIELIHYTAGTMASVEKLSGWQNWLTMLSTLLSLWALCLLLSYCRRSRPAMWGVRCMLALSAFRRLMALILDIVTFQFTSRPGGMDTYLWWTRLNSWVSIILSFLSVAALCILTAGLTRHLRVGKGFWAVPVLAAVAAVCPLLLGLIWEVFVKNVSVVLAARLQALFLSAIPSAVALIRSLVGILSLNCAPVDSVTATDFTTPAENTPKPRMEDYLMRL